MSPRKEEAAAAILRNRAARVPELRKQQSHTQTGNHTFSGPRAWADVGEAADGRLANEVGVTDDGNGGPLRTRDDE
jgi:hypothetical protein